MPGRGRPPIVRTKEEALTARRNQVRENVQAYRRRKQTSSGAGSSQNAKLKDLTFVLEDLGQSKNQDPAPDAVRATQHQVPKAVERNNDGNLPSTTICETVPQRPKTNSHPHYRSHYDNFLALFPQEISAAQVSRQQLASNAASKFSSTLQDQLTGPHWSQIIPDLVNRNVILDFSIQALCLVQVSHINDERWLLQRSLHFYDKALKALQGALAQARDGFRLEIFAATMALGTYELLQGTNAQGRGWQYHIEGATAYLNMFPSLNVSAFSNLYESITTLVSNLHPGPPPFPFDPITIPLNSIDAIIFPQAYTSTSHTFATSILDSVPFCLSPSYGIVGKSLVLLPLFIASNYFRHDGDKQSARRCEDVLAGLGQGEMKFGLRVKNGL